MVDRVLATASQSLEQVWPRLLTKLRDEGGSRSEGIRLWLGSKVVPHALENGALILHCPTPLFTHQIRKHYAEDLARLATELLQTPVSEVVCKVTRRQLEEHERSLAQVTVSAKTQAPATSSTCEDPPTTRSFHPQGWGQGFKHLENFVVGSCNRLAYDAIVRILETPDHPVNPLFIHGGSGLGKTHLEQGLAIAFKHRYPHAKISYMTCEQFRNAYLSAYEAKEITLLRTRLRHVDLLLLDDIHFLSRGQAEGTKGELFATFNELSERGKKVVFTSDAAPNEIAYLEKQFVERFTGGLVVTLSKPDFQVRRSVIQQKALSQNTDIPGEVADYLAEHFTESVRELEGAVNRLVAATISLRRPIDLSLARSTVEELLPKDRGRSRHQQILDAVAKRYDLDPEDLIGRDRSGDRATARHLAMYMLKEAGTESYQAVASFFNAKSHSSVAYACQQVAKARSSDQDLDRFVIDLLHRLRRRSRTQS